VTAAHGNNLDVVDDTARADYLSALIEGINEAVANPASFFLDPKNIEFIQRIIDTLPAADTSPMCNALLSDFLPSSEGAVNQGELSIAFFDAETFKLWGAHYARSLVRAHQLQQCHNFKDPSVQLYCTAAFENLREMADCMFVLLPPPREGRSKTWLGSGASSNQRALLRGLPAERLALLDANPDDAEVILIIYMVVVFTSFFSLLQLIGTLVREAAALAAAAPRNAPGSMISYMDRYGGCFDGSQFVHMSRDSAPRRVCELRSGDVLANGAVILAVVVMHMPAKSRLCTINGVHISPWHPVATDDYEWRFPSTMAPVVTRSIDYLYNVVLSQHHVITINGLHCITLGHGIIGHPVLSHPFFGTKAVIHALSHLPVADDGRIHAEFGFVRDDSGLVCDFARYL
jgi:hypothetical protein